MLDALALLHVKNHRQGLVAALCSESFSLLVTVWLDL